MTWPSTSMPRTLRTDSWRGRHVLINSLCIGGEPEQKKAVAQTELREAKSVIMLQCVSDGEKTLQPWVEQGYAIEKLETRPQGAKGHKKQKRRGCKATRLKARSCGWSRRNGTESLD